MNKNNRYYDTDKILENTAKQEYESMRLFKEMIKEMDKGFILVDKEDPFLIRGKMINNIGK
jgi:hypothetical protein